MHWDVAVVIPTRYRTRSLLLAVESALAQEQPGLSVTVVVVIAGPDEPTRLALRGISDVRIRVVALDEPTLGGDARNHGVAAADSQWIAFLDDDDLWLPGKLSAQLELARASEAKYPVVTCRVIESSSRGDRVLPRRLRRPGEAMGDYLLLRSGLYAGDGLVQTSTLLAPRRLLLELPFTSGLRRHQDWDWVIRADAFRGVAIVFVDRPLVRWVVNERPRLGFDWTDGLCWAESIKSLVSRKALASFLLLDVARDAPLTATPSLVAGAFRLGAPTLRQFVQLSLVKLLPARLRSWLRRIRFSMRGEP